MESNREIFQDNILNASADAAYKVCDQLALDDESWLKLYEVLIKTLNEICGEPEYRNFN